MRVALAKAYFEEENHTAMHAFITPILNSYKLTRFFLHDQGKTIFYNIDQVSLSELIKTASRTRMLATES